MRIVKRTQPEITNQPPDGRSCPGGFIFTERELAQQFFRLPTAVFYTRRFSRMRCTHLILLAVAFGVLVACTKNEAKTPIVKSTSFDLNSPAQNIAPQNNPNSNTATVPQEESKTTFDKSFISACSDTLAVQSGKKSCLYYAINNDVYQLCFPDRTQKYLFSIPKSQKLNSELWETFRVANSRMIWKSEMKLFTWDGKKLSSIPLGKNPHNERLDFLNTNYEVSSFVISRNGQCIAWNTNRLSGYSDDDEMHFPDSAFKTNTIYVAKTDTEGMRKVFSERYSFDGIGSDYNEEKWLVAFSSVHPSLLYLTTKFDRQLFSGFSGLDAIEFTTGKKGLHYGGIEEILSLSHDETKIAYSPNDETCCMSSNQTNNSIVVMDLASGNKITIYDEWKEFQSEGKEDEFYPSKTIFSPTGSLIALSLNNGWLTSIRKSDGSGEIVKLENRIVLGWLDDATLVLAAHRNEDNRYSEKLHNVSIFDLTSGNEEKIALDDIQFLGFE